ncbi:MAG: hypothetical protein QM368_05475 [Bacillota bacterium]|jgi:hypothetical protein|nr:hypothetical protein [Bacillota bacterium]HHU30835.1 hypothetical protein [Bacillota bacterium]
MPEETKLPAGRRSNGDVLMQAEIIDQLNTNQQSNMTLSVEAVITQAESLVKLNFT